MRVGFILTRTFTQEGFKSFQKFINVYIGKDEIIVYLIGNGVYCARRDHIQTNYIQSILKHANIYAFYDDLQARGISSEQLESGIKIFYKYQDMIIDMMENLDQVLCF